mmetsp:Transcript_18910/g.21102  ORF Transcript_18910/g.21102 Transcript_18910/m.21102 type:complete len:238 (-) Transcript_18910:59-772(-)|eukprot:CAMPEP_0194141406 /NCGR_PEP_ID=MMETSP0152-20130528/10816_1 /TAXON_ID=1049557 /ORGANISM="Thalassiothrix antarctica, Strain L6-D1" /LENGTH=237 /DNA_ID=CAMNT_0038840019 /DNA_START=99 /DNA_END=812 /DNA_ORIENTATION=-
MPRNTRAARGILKVLENDSNIIPTIEGDHVMTFNELDLVFSDMQNELERRLEILALETKKAKNAQTQSFCEAIVKIRKGVKKMKVSEFNGVYGCDLLDMLSDNFLPIANNEERVQKKQAAKIVDNATTPDPSASKRLASETIRTIKRGERIFSRNGSPVDKFDEGVLIATVTKKRRRSMGVSASAALFNINVGDGLTINLNNPECVKHMDDELKSSAIHQLQVLQIQMANVMAQLRK